MDEKEAIEIHGFERGTCFRWRLIEDECLGQRVSLLQDWKTWKRRALLRQMVVVIAAAPQRTPAVFSAVYRDGRNHCPVFSLSSFFFHQLLLFPVAIRIKVSLALKRNEIDIGYRSVIEIVASISLFFFFFSYSIEEK